LENIISKNDDKNHLKRMIRKYYFRNDDEKLSKKNDWKILFLRMIMKNYSKRMIEKYYS